MKKKNLVLNQKFGDLTINSAPNEVNGEVVYYCKCSCGKNLSVREVDLKSGNVSSCGCKMEKITNYPMGFSFYTNADRRKEIELIHQREEIERIIEEIKNNPPQPETPDIPEESES